MKLYEVCGIRHRWFKWAETAEDAAREVLKDEPDAEWEFTWSKDDKQQIDFEAVATSCEEIPLPFGYKLIKYHP